MSDKPKNYWGIKMKNDISKILQCVSGRIGVDICAVSENGVAYITSDKAIDGLKYGEFEDLSVKEGKTYFSFSYHGEKYLGALCGVGEEVNGFAKLIPAFFDDGKRENVKVPSIKEVLTGEASEDDITLFINDRFSSKNVSAVVYLIESESENIAEILDFLENFKQGEDDMVAAIDNNKCVYAKIKDDFAPDADNQPITDYAYLLVKSAEEELGEKINVYIGGSVESLYDCGKSYAQALSARRLKFIFDRNSSVVSYREYVLVKAFEEMPKNKLKELLNTFCDFDAKAFFSDGEMITTAEEFLRTNLNLSETARNLYLHRNTLNYRLDKINKLIGLDIREFHDAFTFKVLSVLYKLIENEDKR